MDNSQRAPNLQQAIQLVKAGQRDEARKTLLEIVKINPQDQIAWFWLVEVTDSYTERVTLLERCSLMNPGSERVKKALAKMKAMKPAEPVVEPVVNSGEINNPQTITEAETESQNAGEEQDHAAEVPEPAFSQKSDINQESQTGRHKTKSMRFWINLISGLMLLALVAVAILVFVKRDENRLAVSSYTSNATEKSVEETVFKMTDVVTNTVVILSPTPSIEEKSVTPEITVTKKLIETEIVSSPTPYIPVKTATVVISPTVSAPPKLEMTLLRTLEGAAPVAVNPVGNIMASIKPSRNTLIQLWDPNSGDPVRSFGQDDHVVRCMAFSADGKILATGGEDTEIQLWDVSTGNLLNIFVRHTSPIVSITFSPDGRIAASADRSNKVIFWIVQDSDILHVIDGLKERVYSLRFSPDGTLLATAGADGAVRLWRVSDGSQVNILLGHADAVRSLAFQPESSILASGSGLYGKDQSVWIWNIEKDSGKQLLPTAVQPVNSLAFSPDGSILAAGTGDDGDGNGIYLWHVDSGTLLTSMEISEAVKDVAFSSDGSILLVATDDRILELSVDIQ